MIKNIIIDFKRTIYDPDNKLLLEDALEGLKILKKKGFYLRLVGKGDKTGMFSIIESFGITPFFDDIFIDDNKEEFFSPVDDPSTWLVIGDRAHKEILFGGQLGMHTLWFKNGKFNSEKPKPSQKPPDYIVSSWKEIIEIIKNF